MANLFTDDYASASSGSPLESRTGYTKITGHTTSIYTYSGVVRPSDGAAAGTKYGYRYTAIGSLPNDYDVAADYTFVTAVGTSAYGSCGVIGRVSSTAETFYQGAYDTQAQIWTLGRRVAGTYTSLGVSGVVSYGAGTTIRPHLRMVGDQISLYNGDTLVLGPFTDTAIASGQPGIRYFQPVNTTGTTGIHIDNFSVDSIDSGAVDATATGATLTGTAEIVPGSAEGSPINATADGVILTGTSELVPGSATGETVIDATADGVTLTGTATLTPGTATGGASGTFVSSAMYSSGILQASVAMDWTWYPGAIGAAPTSALVHGSGATNTAGELSAAGLPAGAGILLAKTAAGAFYYEPGTVT